MKICLDPGHNYGLNGLGKDPGAVNDKLGIKESVIALELCNILKDMLTKEGHNICLTRNNGDGELTLGKRCRIAANEQADIFISIHLNSSDNKSANGIETLRYDTKNNYTVKLAKNVQDEMIKVTGARDRGVKIRNDLYVLKHTPMPAILVETGFISNDEEGLKLNDPVYQRKVCEGIVNGIKLC